MKKILLLLAVFFASNLINAQYKYKIETKINFGSGPGYMFVYLNGHTKRIDVTTNGIGVEEHILVFEHYDPIQTYLLSFGSNSFNNCASREEYWSCNNFYIIDPNLSEDCENVSAVEMLSIIPIVDLPEINTGKPSGSVLNKCDNLTLQIKNPSCDATNYYFEYSFGSQGWRELNNTPNSASISINYSRFSVLGLSLNETIQFRVRYVPEASIDPINYSSVLSYSFVDCSPTLNSDPSPIPAKCSYSNDGSFTAEFNRVLDASQTERMMVYLEKHDPGQGPITDDSSWEQGDIDPHIIPDNLAMNGTEITWPAVLPAGTYRLRWLSKYGTGNFDNPNSAEKSDEFYISAPDPITFSSSHVNETCPDSNDGSITFSNVQGGTPPYWYSIENGAAGSWRNTPSFSGLSSGNYTLVVSDHDNNENTRCFSQDEDIPDLERNIALTEPTSSPQVVAGLFAVTPPTVHGGSWSIDISASGGVGSSYSFAWTMDEDAGFSATTEDISNADVVIPSGGTATFKVRAFDSRGCASLERVFTITEPAPLGITFSEPVPIDCYRGTGSIRAQATGGFLGVDNNYTYSWSDNGSTDPVRHNLSPGRYTVTVTDANNNSETESYELQDPDELTVVPIPTMVDCRGGNTGSITLNITGGTGAYNVSWSKVFDDSFSRTGSSVTNLTAGTYFYEITDDNGCTVNNYTTGIEITQVVPTIHIGEDKVLCEGDAHQIDARISDPGALYQWVSDTGFSSTSPEVELTEPGNYILTITNSLGCEASDDVMISRATELVGAQFAVSSQVFTGESVVLVDLSNPTPDVIEWILPEEAEVVASETGYAEVVFKEAGEYVFGMYAELGECHAYQEKRVVVIEREKFTEGEEGDVSENGRNSLIQNYVAYPNPSDGAFTLEIGLSEEKPVSVRIFGLVNNTMVDYRTLQNRKDYLVEYDLRHVSAGVYFIVLETPVSTQVKKLVIE